MEFDEDKVWIVLFGILALFLGDFAALGFILYEDYFILYFFGGGFIFSLVVTGSLLSSLIKKKMFE
ncbi:hypothetical protein HLG78_04735 [Candidatus Absconditicoccus praedator]|nr:hypothetical protein HLG78_04735 [Candidatus Absconditicoccus praedator]